MAQVGGSYRTTRTIYFKNALLLDGTGREPRRGGLIVQDDRIADVGPIDPEPQGDGAEVIDLAGRTLMPGLVLAHVHLSYHNIPDLPDLDLRQSPETATIAAVCNARTLLEHGCTAAISAGSLHRVDIHVRNAIDAGRIPGPRLLAAGRDLCQTGGMLDCNPGWRKLDTDGLGVLADGPWEVRKAVRQLVKDGADLVRMHATGAELLQECRQTEATCTQEEIDALVDEAHRRGRLCSVHARSTAGCKIAARAGADLIDHATFLDDETLDLLTESGCFVVPGLDYLVSTLEHARDGGFPWLGSYNSFLDRTNCEAELEMAFENIARMHERGVRVPIGSDFGFAWCPHGTYARELTHLVKLVGYRPMDAIVAATRLGAEAMGLQDRIGTLEPGKLADLLVVDGNPLHDISLLEKQRNIVCVMKGGAFVRRPVSAAEPEPACV